MAIIFVHGVNTREGPSYDAAVLATRGFLTRHLVGATVGGKALGDRPRVDFPYWGDLATTFAWGGAAVPQGFTETLAAPTAPELPLLLAQIREASPAAPGSEPLTTLAKHRLSLAVDVLNELVLQNAPPGGESAVADFVVSASAYAEANESPPWLTGVDSDDELIAMLHAELTRVPGVQAQGFGDLFNVVTLAGAQLKHAVAGALETVLDRTGDFASTKLLASTRPSLNAVLGRFFGDVFKYLSCRGDHDRPGRIPRRILEAFDEARSRSAYEPFIVIGHSLGGVIAFDLLSHFRPQLEVDLFVSVGSQVAHFEEMKLYRDSNPNVGAPEHATTPANIKRWINVYDPVDVFAYSAKAVFDRVNVDVPYDTQTYVVKAHGAYFQQDRFYAFLRERMRALP